MRIILILRTFQRQPSVTGLIQIIARHFNSPLEMQKGLPKSGSPFYDRYYFLQVQVEIYMIPRTAAVAILTTVAGMTPMTMMITTRAMLTAWVRGAIATAGLSSGSVQKLIRTTER